MSQVKRIVSKAPMSPTSGLKVPMKSAPIAKDTSIKVEPPKPRIPAKAESIITKQEDIQAQIKVLESSEDIKNQEAKIRWAQQKQRDKRMVKGVFHNKEQEGAPRTFTYAKYKGETPVTWTFKDGEVRTIPYGVACHINESGKYTTYVYESPAPGMAKMRIGKEMRRSTFTSLEYSGIL